MSWGYKEIKVPNHPNVRQNGFVLEHRYVAEQTLGRLLKDSEVVHHIDEDRGNNKSYNLIVFSTSSDHSRYHKTGIMVRNHDGTYHSPKSCHSVISCPICTTTFESYNEIYCSIKCSRIGLRVVERPTKEHLLHLIKNKTFVAIGREYNVSDNAVRKWCKQYGLPHRKKDIL